MSFDHSGRPAEAEYLNPRPNTENINVWHRRQERSTGSSSAHRRQRPEGLLGHRSDYAAVGAPAFPPIGSENVGVYVHYGPIRAGTFPLSRRRPEGDARHGRKTFSLTERAVLIPMELVAC